MRKLRNLFNAIITAVRSFIIRFRAIELKAPIPFVKVLVRSVVSRLGTYKLAFINKCRKLQARLTAYIRYRRSRIPEIWEEAKFLVRLTKNTIKKRYKRIRLFRITRFILVELIFFVRFMIKDVKKFKQEVVDFVRYCRMDNREEEFERMFEKEKPLPADIDEELKMYEARAQRWGERKFDLWMGRVSLLLYFYCLFIKFLQWLKRKLIKWYANQARQYTTIENFFVRSYKRIIFRFYWAKGWAEAIWEEHYRIWKDRHPEGHARNLERLKNLEERWKDFHEWFDPKWKDFHEWFDPIWKEIREWLERNWWGGG